MITNLLLSLQLADEDEIKPVPADGAYDQKRSYDKIRKRSARAAIPPRKGTRIWQHGNSKAERHNRDENLRHIRENELT